ncbi:hypothetical protein Tco_1561566 [Tanacetum coccineum]
MDSKDGVHYEGAEIMKISSFMDSLKCPKLEKRFSDKAPRTVNKMMKRLDDFVHFKKAFAQTELLKGETGEQHRKSYFPPTRKDDRPFQNHQTTTDQQRYDPRNNHRGRDNVVSYRGRGNRPPYPPPRGHYQARVVLVLTLDALTKHPKEILATETQLRLTPPRPVINPQRGGNMNRICDYHQEKSHHTNDYHHLRRQLEAALESGKLNHLIKDVRQRGRGNQTGDGPQQAKIINMIGIRSLKDRKVRAREATKRWMDAPITFPLISMEDVSDEPLIVEAELAGPAIKTRLKETQTDLVGFVREATKPLGKIELEVCFSSEGLCRRTTMKFTVIRAPSPYNVILGRTGLRALRAFPSTIHSMMKFPTPRSITTLVTRSMIISECRHLEKKQVVEEKKEEEVETKAVNMTEEILANPAFPNQLVVIGGGLSEACKAQLKLLLKDNMDIFSWEPADMTGVPRRIVDNIKYLILFGGKIPPKIPANVALTLEKEIFSIVL